jgi:hypothetical protein
VCRVVLAAKCLKLHFADVQGTDLFSISGHVFERRPARKVGWPPVPFFFFFVSDGFCIDARPRSCAQSGLTQKHILCSPLTTTSTKLPH